MNIQRGADDGEQPNLQQRKQKQTENAPTLSSDVANELTIRLGEDVLPLPERPAEQVSKRPSAITNAPTTLLGTSSSPSEPPPTKSGPPPDTAHPEQPNERY